MSLVRGGGGGSKMYLRVGEATIFLAHTYKVKTTTTKSYNSDHFFNVGGGGGVQKCNLGIGRSHFSCPYPEKSEVKASGTHHEPALATAIDLFFEIT